MQETIPVNQVFHFPIIKEGNLLIEEITAIKTELEKRFGEDIFIQIILNELDTFSQKMQNRNENIEEELDALSPKLLMGKSFEEICDLIGSNKEEVVPNFKIANEQFENATHIALANEKEQTRVLKSNTPQNE